MQLLFNTIMLELNRWTAPGRLTRPLDDLLGPIRRAGFADLEIWQYHISGLSRSGLEDVAERIRDLDMRASAAGAYPRLHLAGSEAREEQRLLDCLVDYADLLGCRTFKIFPGRVASADADAGVRRLSLERIRRLADRLGERGIALTLETHGGTLCDTLDATCRLLEELDSCDNAGICFQPFTEDDTESAVSAFDRLRDRISHLHLQNRRDGDFCRLEDGTWIDYRRYLPHVRDAAFGGIACLEFTEGIAPPADAPLDLGEVLANARRDRDFVQEVWGRGNSPETAI